MAAGHYLGLVFGCLFIVAGLVKLVPLDVDQTGHGLPDMYKDFNRFLTVLPFRDLLKIHTAAMYMSLVGAAEVVLGALLAYGRPTYRVAAALPLLGMMLGAFYTLIRLGDPLPTTIPSVVFGMAMIYILLNRQELEGSPGTTTSKSKTS